MNLLLKGIAVTLIFALLTPFEAMAKPQPVNPETIHRKLVERGIGNWVCVEEKNGIALVGRVTFIDEQSFGLQLHNYPEVTTIAYADVYRLRTGPSGKAVAALIVLPIAVGVTGALIMHHEFEVNKPTLPTPTLPPAPILAKP